MLCFSQKICFPCCQETEELGTKFLTLANCNKLVLQSPRVKPYFLLKRAKRSEAQKAKRSIAQLLLTKLSWKTLLF